MMLRYRRKICTNLFMLKREKQQELKKFQNIKKVDDLPNF